MPRRAADELDLRVLLAAVEAAPPVDAVDALARELARMLDAESVSLLITNFTGDALVRLSHVTVAADQRDGRNERTETVPLAGSRHERALFGQEPEITRTEGGWDVLVPVTERGDVIGLLELLLQRHPEPDELAYLESAAHALAYVLVASRRHTDLYEWAQRDTTFSLAAEIQRRLLPSAYTVEAGPVTLAGWLEPAAQVGGDTFDYSLDREYLYVSVTDAMGHSTQAALLATLTVGSLRNSRRSLLDPAQQAANANAALRDGAQPDQFVTGLLGRLHLGTGELELVNAGHPPPFLLHDGRATLLSLETDPVLGVLNASYRTTRRTLEPGDRLLLVTDGFLERNASGVDIGKILETGADRHPREVVRELASHVLAATGGNLRDDATVVCLDWLGPDEVRGATSGASRSRATQPD
jgi:serine phosphatase RsbU (regulator of sigma subunit)